MIPFFNIALNYFSFFLGRTLMQLKCLGLQARRGAQRGLTSLGERQNSARSLIYLND
jgi:hypothetical protein